MRNALIAGLLATLTGSLMAQAATERPNVILINVDNHIKGDLGYYGNRFIETPNIDRLFKEGVRFENYWTAGRCTSSRSALLTGRYHARNGALGTAGPWGQTREGVTTLGHVFSQAGYRTAMFGKWHVGDTYPLRPEDRGFDEVVTIHNGNKLDRVLVKPGYNDSARTGEAFRFRHNGVWQVYEGFRTDIWFNELSRYLTSTREDKRPFFVYLATITSHGPQYGPKDLRDKYLRKYQLPEWSGLRQRAEAKGGGTGTAFDHAADIGNLDRNVGKLLDTLNTLDMLDDTVIIYMSDGSGGGKASVSKDKWPEGTRQSAFPCVIRWHGISADAIAARHEQVANIDILPTLADICGITLKPALLDDVDGQSFASLIGSPTAKPWQPRTYIADHQSKCGKDDLKDLPGGAYRMMLFRPFALSRVYLPDGQQVVWRAQKLSSHDVPSDVVDKAKAAYKKWQRSILEDFPLGAFASVGAADVPVYMDAYPIPDGPAGPGIKGYFLLDVAADGAYVISVDASGRYGGKPEARTKMGSATLSLSFKTKPGKLPVGFDAKLNGYRVLPATLKEYFKTTTRKISPPATIHLKKGRYLLSAEFESGKPIETLRVAKKTDR